MSLLRNAERCFANQHTHKLLNAFIATLKHDFPYEPELHGAEERNRDGELVWEKVFRLWLTLHSGRAKSPLDGQLVAIKDNICTTEHPTTCASAILNGFHSPFSATVVERLKSAGALIVGKTNLDEFGMGYAPSLSLATSISFDTARRSHSTNSVYGAVKNVYTQNGDDLSAGGSSGGSAVAVATGQCDA